MKILHVIFTRDFGGAERYVAELSALQAKTGHEVRVLIRPQKKEPNIKNILSTSVQVAWVSKWFQKWHVKKHIEIFEPDVIHCHLGKAAQVVSKIIKPKISTVSTLHIKYDAKKYAKMGGLICLNSEQDPQELGYTGKIVEIGAWVDTMSSTKALDTKALRQSIGVKNADFIIGSLCRLHQQKGLDILIKSFIEANLLNAKLVIVGSGEEELKLKKMPSGNDNIIFVPATDNPQAWYNTFDLFVSASRAESMGLTILEAMAAGLPIISTATVGAKALLAGQPATIIPVDDVEALAVEIAKAHAVGKVKIKYNLDKFAFENVISKIENFYKSF